MVDTSSYTLWQIIQKIRNDNAQNNKFLDKPVCIFSGLFAIISIICFICKIVDADMIAGSIAVWGFSSFVCCSIALVSWSDDGYVGRKHIAAKYYDLIAGSDRISDSAKMQIGIILKENQGVTLDQLIGVEKEEQKNERNIVL